MKDSVLRSFPGKLLGDKTGKSLRRKFAHASGPFRKEAIQYWVLICSSSFPAVKVFAEVKVLMDAAGIDELVP